MNIKIQPSIIHGKIVAPSSKSYMQRAIAIALLAKGKTTIYNPSICNDTISAMSMATKLGAKIKIELNEVTIYGAEELLGGQLSAGESGLGIRMFAPIASLSGNKVALTGEGSLINRPISMIEDSLTNFGVRLKTNNGYLPIELQGPMVGGKGAIDGQISSQVLTGLLIALPLVSQDSVIEVVNLQSKPYIDMTLDIMNNFGVKVENQNYTRFIIKGNQRYTACNYTIEGDWSGSAFHLVAGAIGGSVELTGLNTNSKQADYKIISALKKAGALVNVSNTTSINSILVRKSKLVGFDFDATHCPDLFPPLIVLCANCMGTSKIRGVTRLIHKESNRAEVLQKEMSAIGISIRVIGNYMQIDGRQKISGGSINSNNDHRIAMAGAIAALTSDKGILIEGVESVNKSYPNFFNDLQQITEH